MFYYLRARTIDLMFIARGLNHQIISLLLQSKKSRKREHPGKEDDVGPPVKKIHIKVSDLPR